MCIRFPFSARRPSRGVARVDSLANPEARQERRFTLGLRPRPPQRPIWERSLGIACWLLLAMAVAVGAESPTTSPDTGTLEGRLTTADGAPVTDAEIDVVDLRLHTHVDDTGAFSFRGLPPGSYLLRIESTTDGEKTQRFEISAGEVTRLDVGLSIIRHEDEVVVTASGIARSQIELAQTTTVLTGEDLQFRQQATLGETLAQQPGISSTGFGQGASRPVIRGLGGDRVRMLQGGVDSGDASSTSPDHAVSADPALAERIEVLRGPSTLLYGSSAIGGVVNVEDGSIPSYRPEQALTGTVNLTAGSVADETSGSVALEGGAGDWAWHLGTSLRDADDYDIPGFAEAEQHEGEDHDDEHEGEDHDEEEVFGTLPNSGLESRSISLGFSRFFGSDTSADLSSDKGFVGVAISSFDSEYGIPGAGHSHGEEEGEEHEDEHEGEEHEDEHGHEGEEGEEDIRIDMKRRRVDLRAEITQPFSIFQAFKARIGVVDYEHDEIEGDEGEVGTRFFNDSVDARFEWVQKRRGDLSGSFGLQLFNRQQEAVGEEAFLPASESTHTSVFTFQELQKKGGDLRFQLGARFESAEVKSRVGLPSRSFDGFSVSAGVVWKPVDGWALALSTARSTKLPNAEELYSNGPHFATRAFEVGNLNLEEEISTGFDFSIRKTTGRLTTEISYFRNDFDDFIYQSLTGEQEDGLDVLVFTQADAEFEGLELKARLGLWERAERHLDLSLTGDRVEAELTDGTPLPRIAPQRLSLGLHYHQPKWHAYVEAWEVDDQDRLAPLETPTEGYTMVNAGVSYRFLRGLNIYDVVLRGRNLTDETARNHVSFLKDTVPLPGRDVSLSLRWTF